jgi:hypothetical protein
LDKYERTCKEWLVMLVPYFEKYFIMITLRIKLNFKVVNLSTFKDLLKHTQKAVKLKIKVV